MTADVGTHAVVRFPAVRLRLPPVALPTLLLFTGAMALGTCATWLALTGGVPWWVTVPLHFAAMTGMAVVVHECAHHSAGRLTWLNSALGRLAMPFVSVVGAFPSERYLHLEQHRDPADPVRAWAVRGPAWQLPLRWLVVDVWHICAYLRRSAERPQLEVAEALAMVLLVPGVLIAVAGSGAGWSLVPVYLLPQRLALAAVTWWHDWRPRDQAPGERGYLQAHKANPALPFYRYPEAWRETKSAAAAAIAEGAGEFRVLSVGTTRPLTPRAVELTLDVPDELRSEFRFRPGQHVELRAVVDGEELHRRYAICTLPGEDSLRVAIKNSGRFSRHATTLRPGDLLDVRPPAGEPAFVPGAKHVVVLAAAAGIAPVLPVIAQALTVPRCRVTLVYINRSGEDTMFAEEVTGLARRFEGRLRVLHFRTDERDRDLWPATTARRPFQNVADVLAISDERYYPGTLCPQRLGELLDSRLHPAKVDEWVLCAPSAMSDSALDVLAEHFVPESAIRVETWCQGR
ncbi:fatty acid desaturase [Amycolatopsis pigmentata]|uniref:Fatty acid desaturase n=1 Tax=Amycolatopsis pigmentata TaxID=450801 RepID=A0ABW5G346_9PSEU